MMNMTPWDRAMMHYNWAMHLVSTRKTGPALASVRLAVSGFSETIEADSSRENQARNMISRCSGYLKKIC